LREYQRTSRIVCVALRIRSGIKIDAVALEAGYRSKKDFYGDFKRVFGLTPLQFRNLQVSRAVELLNDARSRLVLRAVHDQPVGSKSRPPLRPTRNLATG